MQRGLRHRRHHIDTFQQAKVGAAFAQIFLQLSAESQRKANKMSNHYVKTKIKFDKESLNKLDTVRGELNQRIGLDNITRTQTVEYIVNTYLNEQKGSQNDQPQQ